jgi:hypothetical protein
MKKNKDKDNKNKESEEKINKSNLDSSSDEEKNSNELDNRLDDIKKLADDFSMSDEPNENEESIEINDSSETKSSEEDFLDRLDDLVSESTSSESTTIDNRFEKDEEKHNKETEPEQIDNDLINDSKTSPFITPSDFETSVEDKLSEDEEKTSQDLSNEEFLARLTNSLEEDPDFKSMTSKQSGKEVVFKTYDHELDDSELIEDLEHEIENADKAVNPFRDDQEPSKEDDFISNLDSLDTEEYTFNGSGNKIDPSKEIEEEGSMLSSSSWKDLLESTDENTGEENAFDFENEDSFEDFLQKIDTNEQEEDVFAVPLLPEDLADQAAEGLDQLITADESLADYESDLLEENPESVDSLRRSFIDEFDQTAWNEELENLNKKKWLPRTIENFTTWFKSLNFVEKTLILLSFLISLAVLVSIFLVVTQWSVNNRKVASPPPSIEASDADLIYPTGLQLPGGWFFFLERGEIKDNKWEPVSAEWLANTKLRRVIAIPWSNQSESVIQSLSSEDEISIYMNNNDISVYQVEEVLQISRDNVRILSDTEPSLVVILFREDNEDRWAVIAKPK